jgi:tetratricopeptide (TPR) repeat protein
MLKIRLITAVLLVSILALSAGCDSHAQKKQAAQLRWEQVTAKAKMPVARNFLDEGKIADAEKIIIRCLKADPEMPEVHLLMGRVHMAYGRIPQAEKSLTTAVELDSNCHHGWYLLAGIAMRNKQPAQALDYYNRAVLLAPANTDYIISLAEIHAARGDSDSGLALLQEKIELFPHKLPLKVAAANILHRMGNTTQAILMYNQAFLLNSADPEIIESLGYCYITNRQWSHAAKMFEKLIADSDDVQKTDYLQLLAMCSMNAGEYGKATSYYNRLSVEQRDNPELWLQMGQAALGADSPVRALTCANRALMLRPAWEDAIALKGCALYLSGDYSSAVENFKKITSKQNYGGFAWFMLARCYQQFGETAQARKAYEKAFDLNPESKLITLLAKPHRQI